MGRWAQSQRRGVGTTPAPALTVYAIFGNPGLTWETIFLDLVDPDFFQVECRDGADPTVLLESGEVEGTERSYLTSVDPDAHDTVIFKARACVGGVFGPWAVGMFGTG
jgi:hypothetical protein